MSTPDFKGKSFTSLDIFSCGIDNINSWFILNALIVAGTGKTISTAATVYLFTTTIASIATLEIASTTGFGLTGGSIFHNNIGDNNTIH